MAEPSTVVNMIGTSPKIIRQGKVLIVSFDPMWVNFYELLENNTELGMC